MLPENYHTESQPYLSGFPAQHDPDVPLSDTEEKENTTHLLSAVQAYRCQGFRQSEILPAVPSLLLRDVRTCFFFHKKERLSQEKVFQGAKEDELFWRESVTAPVEQTLRLLEEPKKEIKLQVKEKDLTMADVLVRDIREKAEERWKAIETERNQSKAVLTPENRKVFDVLFEAYVATEELQKHPRLQKALEKQLLSVFVAAQKKGITVGLNEYSMDAPSRNQTIIQVKQPARDREKQ